MSHRFSPYTWAKYSRKVHMRILEPAHVGVFHPYEADPFIRLVIGSAGDVEDGNCVALYLMVSEREGEILAARFQAYGHTALVAAADVACELLIGKNYDQARRITHELIDTHLQTKKGKTAFPPETIGHLKLVISAISDASEQCNDIPFASGYVATPITSGGAYEGEAREIPGWVELSLEQKIAILAEVIDAEVRPYVELDEGGVRVVTVKEGEEVIIAYEGNCTSCYSAIGGTLSAIQNILQRRVYPSLTVTPDLTSLTL